jgi:hypothetical protein
MKNAIFLNVIFTANVFLRLMIFTLKMEAICSSERSVLTTAPLRHITEDGIHRSHLSESVKSYKALTGPEL